MRPQVFAILVLIGVAAYLALTIYTRLQDGCSFKAGRSGGWDCAHAPGASSTATARP